MCGIVAYQGKGLAPELILQSLRRLEYRGYDSAGIGVIEPSGDMRRVRVVGGVEPLEEELAFHNPLLGMTGIGHTRWATHGAVSEANAHPFFGCDGGVLVAVNGIVTNAGELRERLLSRGHVFESETDSEVIAHLLEGPPTGDFAQRVAKASLEMEGHFALVALRQTDPDTVVGHASGCPLVAGNDGEGWHLASSASAFGPEVAHFLPLAADETAVVTSGRLRVFDGAGAAVDRRPEVLDHDALSHDRGAHGSYMAKEIAEQPQVVQKVLNSAFAHVSPSLPSAVDSIVLTGCGTSHHSALLGRTLLESWAEIPCTVEVASEWRPTIRGKQNQLVIGLTQSGETADTIDALAAAREHGFATCAITNVPGSRVTRVAENVIITRAGFEVAVAATKTFVAQVLALAAFAVELGYRDGPLHDEDVLRLRRELVGLESKMSAALDSDHECERVAKLLADADYAVYLGRNAGLPVALEGALKVKEIAYLPVEACGAGEVKHGPIALIDDDVPVVVIALPGVGYEETLVNISEVRARGGRIVAIAGEGDRRVAEIADEVIRIAPSDTAALSALTAVLPLQLLSLHTARHRGLDPDRPRNLAKTVTVR